jgi:hypothetical protein
MSNNFISLFVDFCFVYANNFRTATKKTMRIYIPLFVYVICYINHGIIEKYINHVPNICFPIKLGKNKKKLFSNYGSFFCQKNYGSFWYRLKVHWIFFFDTVHWIFFFSKILKKFYFYSLTH